jgi:hypothetical protein
VQARLAHWMQIASSAQPRTVLAAGATAAAMLLGTFTLIVAHAAESGPKRYAQSEKPVLEAGVRRR